MPTTSIPTPRREDGSPSHWDRYLEVLARRGVPEKMRPWYVRRVESLLKALHPASLSRVTAEEIAGYLREASAQAQVTDWQFRQLVDALQLLFVDLGHCSAGKEIDWDWWNSGGRWALASDRRRFKASRHKAACRSRVYPRRRGCSAVEDPGPVHPGEMYLIRTEPGYFLALSTLAVGGR